MLRSERIELFCSGLLDWYQRHKRTLPWRDLRIKNLDRKAYLILVSEVMLQQTQVSRVVILYKKFVQKFPRIEDLAAASNREIVISWKGLGYNNRALRLRDTARRIVENGGKFPRDMDALQKLPGVGHYTAAAIRNFAFEIPTPCLDVNIRRILHRFFVGHENPDGTWKKDDRYLLKIAEEALNSLANSPSSPSSWHAALMDFGSMVCTKNSPKWHLFPPKLRSCCIAYGKDVKRTKKVNKREPGREIAGRFVPNRIIRGRIVDELREAKRGLTFQALGSRVAIDWPMTDERTWLEGILMSLKKDGLLRVRGRKYFLA